MISCNVKIFCSVRSEKVDPHQTRTTIGGNKIQYNGDVGTKDTSFKLVIYSVLSRHNAKFVTFGISNFYLGALLERPEYIRIKANDIPAVFYNEYGINKFLRDGWVYFEFNKGIYGLPQAGSLANQLLENLLALKGY